MLGLEKRWRWLRGLRSVGGGSGLEKHCQWVRLKDTLAMG